MTEQPGQLSAGSESRVELDLAALSANIEVIRGRVAPAEVMIVVKADGYGHGALAVARAAVATGIRQLGVLTAAEGLALRAAGIGEPVRLFAWLHDPEDDFRAAVAAGIDLGVSTVAQLERAAAAARAEGRPARLHLKIDTGLHRDGASPEEWTPLVTRAVALGAEGLVEIVAAWSHIAEASDAADDLARERFLAAVAEAEALGAGALQRHLAASSASWLRPEFRFELVRIGAHAAGIPVFDGGVASEMGLVPTLSLHSVLADVRELAPEAPEARLGVVPLGLADAIPAAVAGRVGVSIRGILRPVIEVGLDHLLVALGAAPAEVGDEVVLFGAGGDGEQTVREWGDAAGTIGEEIVTQLPASLPRVLRGEGGGRR